MGAKEDIEGVLDVQIGSQLAGGDALPSGYRRPGPAVGEEAVPEILGRPDDSRRRDLATFVAALDITAA
jgi:hypothetical protein